MLNIGTKNIDTIYSKLWQIIMKHKCKWNLLPAGNVIIYMHISYIIDILYNWTNFMSNISFIYKIITDWTNKDNILKLIWKGIYTSIKKVLKYFHVFNTFVKGIEDLIFKYILSMYLVFKYKKCLEPSSGHMLYQQCVCLYGQKHVVCMQHAL